MSRPGSAPRHALERLARARVELVDGGHFLLESHLDEVAGTIRDWLMDRA